MFRIVTDPGAAAECDAVIYPVRREPETRVARFAGRTVQLRCISPGDACAVPSSEGEKKTFCAVLPDRAGGDGAVCAAAVIAGFEEAERAGAGSVALFASGAIPPDALFDFVVPAIREYLEEKEAYAVVITDSSARETLRARTPDPLASLISLGESPAQDYECRVSGASPAPKLKKTKKIREKRLHRAKNEAAAPSFESEEATPFGIEFEKAETRLPPPELCADFAGAADEDLERLIGQIDESFSEMLLQNLSPRANPSS